MKSEYDTVNIRFKRPTQQSAKFVTSALQHYYTTFMILRTQPSDTGPAGLIVVHGRPGSKP